MPHDTPTPESIEMPAPTIAPVVLALGTTLLLAGVVTNLALSVAGLILALVGAVLWFGALVRGTGEISEPLVPPDQRARPARPVPGSVERLQTGMAGYRMQIPEKIHPYSAGMKGGIIGGIAMTLPASLYCLFANKGIWLPVNLLAGMVLPDVAELRAEQLDKFNIVWLVVGLTIHAVISVGLGLMYGVLLPMLGNRPLLWGGLIMPLLWTGATYSFLGVLNPALREFVDWKSFIAAQFIYGLVVGTVVVRTEKIVVSTLGGSAVDPWASSTREGQS
jgi:hypothetical protein